MIISVASGKGGTGKTTIAVNLALSLNNVQLIDCDVEEPNAALFLNPIINEEVDSYISVPQINEDKCDYCGKCSDVCEYNAIAVLPKTDIGKGNIVFFSNLCHGCGACSYLCPQNTISEVNRNIGVIRIGKIGDVQFLEGKLNVGEAMAPPVIRQLKQHIDPDKTVIIDAPPGTSCSAISSVKDTDFCLLVTEPTPFGLNDLKLAVETMRKLETPFGVVINRFDLGDSKTEDYCNKENIPILMRIPFSKEIASSYSRGEPLVKLYPDYIDKFCDLSEAIEDLLEAGIEQ